MSASESTAVPDETVRQAAEYHREHLKVHGSETGAMESTLFVFGLVPRVETPQTETDHDAVNHPQHYTSHPSGIECIQITEHMTFCLGNAIKYLWRADLKADAIEDLRKARWYLDREIARREVDRLNETEGVSRG